MTRIIRLRPWQKAALDQFVDADKPDFLAVATPGAGKTTFALTAGRDQRHASAPPLAGRLRRLRRAAPRRRRPRVGCRDPGGVRARAPPPRALGHTVPFRYARDPVRLVRRRRSGARLRV